MDASSKSRAARDVLVVDLGSLKGALVERAKARGVSLSFLVREILSEGVCGSHQLPAADDQLAYQPPASDRTRISLRMARDDAAELVDAAERARLPLGLYVRGLVERVPLLEGTFRPALVAALVASNAAMSTLSRHLAHLVDLVHRGSFAAAQEYDEVLATLSVDVRRHLSVASEGLAALLPARADGNGRSPSRKVEDG
jgi:hypothetical protein